jgi:polyribonucleotide nucleotidyltransferase
MLEILKTYPKAAQVIKQWALEKMLDTIKDDSLPEHFKEAVREMGISDDKIADVFKKSSRSLFDVFDNHKLYITVDRLGSKFVWWINEKPLDFDNKYETRKEAEDDAIQKAFELLNNKL